MSFSSVLYAEDQKKARNSDLMSYVEGLHPDGNNGNNIYYRIFHRKTV